MYIVLHSLTGSFCRSLEERTHIHVKAAVGITGSNNFRTAVMAILSHLRNHDTGLTSFALCKFLTHLLSLDKVRIIEDLDYDNLVISIKSSDVMMCAKAHELIADRTPYPLHVGITEAGTLFSGNIKSAVGLGIILSQGIGDTIRVSLTGDPVEEVKSARLILRTLGLRKGGIEVVSCPTCGRTKIDLIGLANQVETMVAKYPLDIKVAVMGCVVNGPGEAKEADIGIAGGIGEGLLIRRGKVVKKLPEAELLNALEEELRNWNHE